MADYYTTMANMKKAAREDDMAAKNGKGLSESIQSVGSSAKLAMMKESERAKAMEKGAAVSAKLKGGPLPTKTVTGPAKK